MDFTPAQVTEALTARQVSTQCPRCSTPDGFEVVDGFVFVNVVNGQNLRHAALTCRQCGYLSLHSLVRLGFEY